ncbi:MAG: outer membrane beta-barrel domain-containing protein [Bacteriovorax sp.]|nr:outer membrane beta-barrel domain-containing protein [Bacteriovorax sp.]
MKSKVLASLVLFMLVFTTNLFANEKDIYEFSWLDPDKEVFVLQNRKYRKADHVYVNVGGGITTSGAFVDATSIQGRIGYFFSEDWGLEAIYAKNSGKENNTAKGVRNSGGGGTGTTPFRRIVESYTGAMLLWSPFYSKINTFNKIVYMDWIFGVGYAQLKEKNNKLRFTDGAAAEGIETSESHSGVMWEAGLKFYINESFNIRTDLTAVHYSANNIATAGTSMKSNFDTTLSLGYTF